MITNEKASLKAQDDAAECLSDARDKIMEARSLLGSCGFTPIELHLLRGILTQSADLTGLGEVGIRRDPA